MADGQTALGAGYSVTLNRTFNAPIDLVFDCFTKGEHLAKWWGPYGFSAPNSRTDPRVGGEVYIDMQGPGVKDNPCIGEILEIDPPKKLVFTLNAFRRPDGEFDLTNHNTILFEERMGRTAITLITKVLKASPELAGALSGMKAGWGQSLEKLGDLVGGGGKMDMAVSDKQIVLTRAFDATPEKLWRAHTDPKIFPQWFADCDGQAKLLEMDVRPDGAWRLEVPGQEGGTHQFWGRYLVIEPPSRLVQTQGFDDHAEIEVETTFTEEWGRTVLTRTMRFPSNEYRDGMAGSGLEIGASDGYDRLAALLKAG